ncbi:RCC1 domain-containing protein [Thioalbus denitrificans]|uniref:Regulator of Chromosome Condensation (RCC1) repeat protein n=1 Tax=Thioalbus denitrificans TaxID=547122 RepID=A0A369CFF8_9GAMM|nr:hypothetical protein [Thioalbus denitrificans]RCX31287.1 Regulator of Chromosome Condensation (RCC1) repeat protein [Thioalbus denitrificans]
MNAGHHDGLWRLALLALLKPCLFLAIASGALYGLPALSEGPRVHPVDIAVGWGQSCILGDNGHVWCWGNKLLNGQAEDTATPTRVQGVADIRKIAAGRLGTCAIDASRKVICWGMQIYRKEFSAEPYLIEGLPPAQQVAIGFQHFCALTTGREVYCWGANAAGEIGDGTVEDRLQPVKVEGVSDVIALDAGVNNTCAIEAGGTIKCWGTDDPGNPEQGFAISSFTPKVVQGPGQLLTIRNARNYVCGIRVDGILFCWGSPYALPVTDGKLYTVPEAPRAFAVILSGEKRVIDVGLGAFSGCAVFENGQMHCWDYNDEPKPAPDFEGVERISMDSQTRGCALLRGGLVRCWDIDISDNEEISIPD